MGKEVNVGNIVFGSDTRRLIAAGCDGIFMEVHDQPDKAKSDAATQWPLNSLEELLRTLLKIHEVVR